MGVPRRPAPRLECHEVTGCAGGACAGPTVAGFVCPSCGSSACSEFRPRTWRIEIDDAYLGGERHGAKPGRGSPNKVSFIAAVQTTILARLIRAACSTEPHAPAEQS